jgi:hypothetical protein
MVKHSVMYLPSLDLIWIKKPSMLLPLEILEVQTISVFRLIILVANCQGMSGWCETPSGPVIQRIEEEVNRRPYDFLLHIGDISCTTISPLYINQPQTPLATLIDGNNSFTK